MLHTCTVHILLNYNSETWSILPHYVFVYAFLNVFSPIYNPCGYSNLYGQSLTLTQYNLISNEHEDKRENA